MNNESTQKIYDSKEIIQYLDNISISKYHQTLKDFIDTKFHTDNKVKSWFILFFKSKSEKIIGFWWGQANEETKTFAKIQEEIVSLKNKKLIDYDDIQCNIYYFPDIYPIYLLAYEISKKLKNNFLPVLLNRKNFILAFYEIIDFIKENLIQLAIIFSANFFILAAALYMSHLTEFHFVKIINIFHPLFYNINYKKNLLQQYSIITSWILLSTFLIIFTFVFINLVFAFFINKTAEKCLKKIKKKQDRIYDLLYLLFIETPLITITFIIEGIFYCIYYKSNNLPISSYLTFFAIVSLMSFVLLSPFSKNALKSFDYPYIYYVIFFTLLIIFDFLLFI